MAIIVATASRGLVHGRCQRVKHIKAEHCETARALNIDGHLIGDFPGNPSSCPLDTCKWTTRASSKDVVT